MAVHRDGTGTGWGDVENLDIDQPHGKDYLQLNHIAKGVRKRVNKEHEAFGDTTAGGEHLAGGCRILGITDATADITTGAGDASIDLTVGKFIGRGLIYDQTTNSLWCYTGDGTVTDDPYEMKWAARSICMGDDFSTWTGNHQFDSSVDFSAIEVTGPALFDDSVGISGQLQCGSKALFLSGYVDSTFEVLGEADFSKALFEGTITLYDECDMSDVQFDGTFSFDTGAVFNHLGDQSARVVNTTYQAATDGEVAVASTAQQPNFRILTDSNAAPVTAIAKCRNDDGNSFLSCPVKVKKGNYWCVSSTGGAVSIYWLPYGDNT